MNNKRQRLGIFDDHNNPSDMIGEVNHNMINFNVSGSYEQQ